MGVRIDVPPRVLKAAAQAWDDAQDQMVGAGKRLRDLEVSGVSPAVAVAVEAYVDTWSAEVGVLVLQAAANATAFEDLELDLEVSDRAEAERIRSLLPWAHAAAPIVGR